MYFSVYFLLSTAWLCFTVAKKNNTIHNYVNVCDIYCNYNGQMSELLTRSNVEYVDYQTIKQLYFDVFSISFSDEH